MRFLSLRFGLFHTNHDFSPRHGNDNRTPARRPSATGALRPDVATYKATWLPFFPTTRCSAGHRPNLLAASLRAGSPATTDASASPDGMAERPFPRRG